MKTKLKLHLLFLAILSATVQARAQGTAFTYQGRLNASGNLANGNYDLKFSLFDDPVLGNQVGASLTNAPTSVSNGLFTVTLDFGAAVFTGDPRWLEIGVTPNGSGEDFTPLSLRQALTASPYAIFAGTAANVASGSVVTGLNGLKDDVMLAAGDNVTLTPNGNTLTIASVPGGTGIWSALNGSAYYNIGNVGIGTAGPLTPLEVIGPIRSTRISGLPQYIQLNGGDSGSIKLTAQSNLDAEKNLFIENLSGQATPGVNNNMQFVLGTTAARSIKMTLTKDGNVGIGTATPARKLTVSTPAYDYGFEHTDGTVRLGTYLDGSSGWLGTVSNHPLKFFVNDGVQPSMTLATSGNFGIGTATPQVKLDVRGAGVLEATIWSANERAILSLNSTLGGQSRIWTLESGVFGTPGLFGIYDRTAGRAGLTIDTAGMVSVGVLRITGGADLAEPFQMKEEELAKGSVVVIDDEHPGRLKRSQSAYDTRVAGIISGANGINPGIALHQQGAMEGGQNVALSGRVYVQADAAFGAIKPGDLLTTSDTPGHAMRVTEHGKAQGAILGKAMGTLKEGKGLVLVLVSLQ